MEAVPFVAKLLPVGGSVGIARVVFRDAEAVVIGWISFAHMAKALVLARSAAPVRAAALCAPRALHSAMPSATEADVSTRAAAAVYGPRIRVWKCVNCAADSSRLPGAYSVAEA